MTNEQIIWQFLYNKFKNVYGVAAMMGNLFAESSLNPVSANGIYSKGLTNVEYTRRVDEGEKDDFATDGIAYGLVQWCYKTRKQGLLDLARAQGKSIGDLNLQLDYMWKELQKYKTVLKAIYNATNVREVSDIIMLKYEKPSNTNEYMRIRRANYGEKYLQKYGDPTININVKLETATTLFDELSKAID